MRLTERERYILRRFNGYAYNLPEPRGEVHANELDEAAAIFWRSGQTIRDTQLRFAISMAGTARQYPD